MAIEKELLDQLLEGRDPETVFTHPALTSPTCNAPGGASASRRALRTCVSTICATALPRARWLSARA